MGHQPAHHRHAHLGGNVGRLQPTQHQKAAAHFPCDFGQKLVGSVRSMQGTASWEGRHPVPPARHKLLPRFLRDADPHSCGGSRRPTAPPPAPPNHGHLGRIRVRRVGGAEHLRAFAQRVNRALFLQPHDGCGLALEPGAAACPRCRGSASTRVADTMIGPSHKMPSARPACGAVDCQLRECMKPASVVEAPAQHEQR